MNKGYTVYEMRKEVKGSEGWIVGLRASIKKWEQIVSGDEESYNRDQACGLCEVSLGYKDIGCRQCKTVFPAIWQLCCDVDPDDMNPKRILAYLRRRLTQLEKPILEE